MPRGVREMPLAAPVEASDAANGKVGDGGIELSNRESTGSFQHLSVGSIVYLIRVFSVWRPESMPKRIVILELPTAESQILKYITIPSCNREGRLRSGSSNEIETIELSDIIQRRVALSNESIQQENFIVKYGNVLQFVFEGRAIRATVIGAAMHNFFLVSHVKISDDLEAFAGHGIVWGIGAVERGVRDGTIKVIDSALSTGSGGIVHRQAMTSL